MAAAILFMLQPAVACQLPATLTHTVTGILDARTLKLDDGTELRLASILAPTPYDSPAGPKQWPAETAATNALSKLTLHRNIAISLERTARDRYDRRVGHALFFEIGKTPEEDIKNRWLQYQLVGAGHARVTLTPETDTACARQLLNLEARAQSAGLGLWSQATYQAKRAEDARLLTRYRSTYQIVEGVVARVAVLKSAVYLNFGADWKRDFSAKLSRSMLKRARIDPGAMKTLYKHPVRIRGWIEKRNGPLITIWRPEQIELLSLTPSGETRRGSPISLLLDIADGRR